MRQLRDKARLNDNIHLLQEATSSELGEVVILCFIQYREAKTIKWGEGGEKEEDIFQTKEQEKTLETDNNKTEISDLPDKGFKIVVIKMLTKVRTMHQQSENSTKRQKICESTKQKSQSCRIQ